MTEIIVSIPSIALANVSIYFRKSYIDEEGDSIYEDGVSLGNGDVVPEGYLLNNLQIRTNPGFYFDGEPYFVLYTLSGRKETWYLSDIFYKVNNHDCDRYCHRTYRVEYPNDIDLSNYSSVELCASLIEKRVEIHENDGVEITVERLSSMTEDGRDWLDFLENGDVVFDGDELRIIIKAIDGKEITNAYIYNGDDEEIVTDTEVDTIITSRGKVIVGATAEQPPSNWPINIEEGIGTVVTVERLSSTNSEGYAGFLENGDMIYEGDELHITVKPDIGYKINESKVYHNDSEHVDFHEDGLTITVVGNVTITTTAGPFPYTLTIDKNINTFATTVERVESPLAGADTCELIDGDHIYYGDILTITIQANENYILPDIAYSGLEDSDHISPVNTNILKIVGKKVTGNAGISVEVNVPYILVMFFKDDIHNIYPRIKRIESILGANLIEIGDENGNKCPIYPGDTLQDITVFSSEEYELKGLKFTAAFGGEYFEIPKGGTCTVPHIEISGLYTAELIIKRKDGLVSIDNGTSFEKYMIYIDNGTSWDRYLPYIDNGTSWDLYN